MSHIDKNLVQFVAMFTQHVDVFSFI